MLYKTDFRVKVLVATSFTVLALFLSFISAATPSAPAKHRSLCIKFIHRDSQLSPFYNPDDTLFDRNTHAFKTSRLRYAYLTGTGRFSEFQGQVVPDNGEYLAKFSIGTPPVEILAIFDTGSDLSWIQCLPCGSCYAQPSPVFDPSKSLTYTNITCDSPYCNLLKDSNCDFSNWCNYTYAYADWSYSRGTLASEVLTVESSDEGLFPVYNIIFGCGQDNKNIFASRDVGILALGARKLSLVSQMQSTVEPKFSYCFGDRNDPSTEGLLVLGDDMVLSSQTTPFYIFEGKYYLSAVRFDLF